MVEKSRTKSSEGIVLQKKHIVILTILVMLLVGCGIILGLNWKNWFENQASVPQNPNIDPNAEIWRGEQPPNENGEKRGIEIPGYPSIAIPAETRDVSVALLNPEGNPCYFTFELVLRDTEEVLYTSKLVPPGQAIYEITLSRPLEAGEYDAVIRLSTTSVEDGSAMNGANIETVLIVQ